MADFLYLGRETLVETTTAVVTDGDTFTLTAGSTANDKYNYWPCFLKSGNGIQQNAIVNDYTGGTKTVELYDVFPTTPANGDTIVVGGLSLMDGKSLYVAANGMGFTHTGGLVTETYTIRGAATGANLLKFIDALLEMLQQAREYHQRPQDAEAIYLYWTTDDEDVDKRSLIYGYEVRNNTFNRTSPFLSNDRAELTVAITRMDRWELDTETSETESNVSTFGGWSLVATTPYQQLDSRIHETQVTLDTGGSAIGSIWLSLLSTRYNNVAAGGTTFSPIIDSTEAEAITSASETGTGGYGTTYLECTTGSAFVEHGSWQLEDWSGGGNDWRDYRGKFLVLARMQASVSGDTHEVYITEVFGGDSVRHESIYVATPDSYTGDSANWHLYPMGEITIPPIEVESNLLASSTAGDQYEITFNAQRVSGSGVLRLDAFLLMPSEYMFWSKGVGLAVGETLYVRTSPNGVTTTTVESAGGIIVTVPEYEAEGWAMPRAVGHNFPTSNAGLILATDGGVGVGQDLNDTCDVVFKWYPAYRGYRYDRS